MPIISQGVPAFASDTVWDPSHSNDTDPASAWVSNRMPGWLAYDLSATPAASRQQILVAWYALHQGGYTEAPPNDGTMSPIDYVIETNSAPGGRSTAPTTGWVAKATVTANVHSSQQHLIALDGANWVRMRVTRTSDPQGHVSFDMDVYSAPSGPSDSWLFLGDSITSMYLMRAFSDLPAKVHALTPSRWPAIIDAAIGGTATSSAMEIEPNGKTYIDNVMATFPGRYVVLAYGTNDGVDGFVMEALVQRVIAAGKVPVVPHVPWSDQKLADGPVLNQRIDALYAKYPQIVRGPDLWAAFLNRTDWIPHGDVHPNDAGGNELRRQWAAVIARTGP